MISEKMYRDEIWGTMSAPVVMGWNIEMYFQMRRENYGFVFYLSVQFNGFIFGLKI